ncbi:MAG: ribonuclease P protein component [Magnetococcales bacterium]|nr:ribonuclease P protein component [Magnetococcales bacterium]MBF0439751.1 ribonuclease P protein component [Magnetococcales bacterium]
MDFRFPKSARLLKPREFQRVSSQGRRLTTRLFILLVRDTDQKLPRAGLTVSRKVGNAVTRNRVKRVMREFFRLHRPNLQQNIECVMIAKPQAGQTVNAELTQNLHELFVRFVVK